MHRDSTAGPRTARLTGWALILRRVSRLVLAAGVASVVWVWHPWEKPKPPPQQTGPLNAVALRQKPINIDWSREQFRTWASVDDGLSVRYPARFDETRGFGAFTGHQVAGEISESDAVAFRSMEPRSAIVIGIYRSPKPLSWAEWQALARAPAPSTPTTGPTPLSADFGGTECTFTATTQGGRPALAASAKGAVRFPVLTNDQWELWRFESRFMAQGNTGVRITAGVHEDHFSGAKAGLEMTLDSFRWALPASPSR